MFGCQNIPISTHLPKIIFHNYPNRRNCPVFFFFLTDQHSSSRLLMEVIGRIRFCFSLVSFVTKSQRTPHIEPCNVAIGSLSIISCSVGSLSNWLEWNSSRSRNIWISALMLDSATRINTLISMPHENLPTCIHKLRAFWSKAGSLSVCYQMFCMPLTIWHLCHTGHMEVSQDIDSNHVIWE